jgi:hypothetical protein
LTTSEITDITKTTAFSGGNISDDKGGSITAKGVCWGVATNPTTANNKTADGTGTGSFISNISNLEPETVYYVRAYATNSAGTAYGTEVVFKTLDNYILYSTTQVGGGSSIPNTLILIDPWNGRGIITGSIGKAKEQFSMDVDPITGSLFGVNPNLPGVIEKIDVKNGESSSIFTISQSDVPLHIWGIAFSPDGILYGVLENRILGIIDLNKGTFSSIQQIGSEGIISGIDFSPQGTLYAIKETYNPDVQFLITIDEKTAIITSSRILLESYTVGDIDYSSDGFIYGTNFSWALLRIDPITLHITIVGFNDLGALGGIASIPQ